MADVVSDNLCNLFQRQSHWVWQRLGQAQSRKFMFSETTITELLLLELVECVPNLVTVVPFKPAEERKNGADWQWCFADHSSSLFAEVRIQAKRLYRDGRYGSLLHKYDAGTPRFQMNRLIDEASRAKIPPLYVFYNHLGGANAKLVAHSARAIEMWGCSFATADDVKSCIYRTSRGYSGTQFSRIASVSRPWHELVCLDLFEAKNRLSLPERIATVIRGDPNKTWPSISDELIGHVTRFPKVLTEWEGDPKITFPIVTEVAPEEEKDLFDEITASSITKEYEPSEEMPTYVEMSSAEVPIDPLTGFVKMSPEQQIELQSEFGDVPGAVIIREPGQST